MTSAARLIIRSGDCFKTFTSYGSGNPDECWLVYRRVRKTIAGHVEVYRFETRSDGMHALYIEDSIPTEALSHHTRIEPEEWEQAWFTWWRAVADGWQQMKTVSAPGKEAYED